MVRRVDVPERADARELSRADVSTPWEMLQLLPYRPALASDLSAPGGPSLVLRAERLDIRPDAATLFSSLYGTADNAVWLDSSNAADSAAAPARGSGEQSRSEAAERSRFSIMADDGGLLGRSVTHTSGRTKIRDGCASATFEGPFFRWLDTIWGDAVVDPPEDYPCQFTLGWLGCLGYELKRETSGANKPAPTPDVALIFAARGVVLDHAERTAWLLALDAPDADGWFTEARAAVQTASGSASQALSADGSRSAGLIDVPAFRSRETAKEYCEKIAAAQHEIAEGNTYEVCLTTTLSATVPAAALDPWRVYLALRRKNPAPFASYLRLDNLTVASTSPERFLKIASDGGMRAEPIKGTRPRASDPAEDARLRLELETSLKDRAENIMIVDLLRNDLSHFAIPGSVAVSRLCAIESYATVHQMVSTIDAQLQPKSSRAKALAACFPAGSMTGAPKISTMAILDRLEGEARGLYSGAVGYFSLNGATDLAVAIRTLVIREGGDGFAEMSLGVGGAITADSQGNEEYEEIRAKAFGILSTLGAEFPGD